MLRFIYLLFALILAGSTVLPQTAAKLDKAHSSIEFATEHIVVPGGTENPADTYYSVGKTNGRFQKFDIQYTPGKNDFTGSRISANIQVASIDTDNGPRDEHLRSKAFFDAMVFPQITFTSTSIEKNEMGQYLIKGLLMIKGVSREVVFTVEQGDSAPLGDAETYTSFTATTSINRLDFGLKWNELLEKGAFRVSNYVALKIQANFQQQK